MKTTELIMALRQSGDYIGEVYRNGEIYAEASPYIQQVWKEAADRLEELEKQLAAAEDVIYMCDDAFDRGACHHDYCERAITEYFRRDCND